jgi:TadE-like protein
MTQHRIYRGEEGQSMVEMAFILPILVVTALAVVEVSYALLDQHIVSKLSREGSNLISRDVALADAGTAMRTMTTRPVNFDVGSRLVFSVLKKVATGGSANFDRIVLYQRYEMGALAATSAIRTSGNGSFGAGPDYIAVNSDNDARLRVVGLPGNIDLNRGNLLYVTEVFTRHPLITPVDRFGISVPETLYSIAYF